MLSSRFAPLTLVVGALGLGCAPTPDEPADDGAPTPVADDPPASTSGTASASKATGVDAENARLKLAPAKMTTDDDPSRTIELLADGTVKLGGRPVGVIDPVAATLGTEGGTVVATLGEDGKVEASRGLPVQVVADGVQVALPNGRLYAVKFEAEGTVTMKPADGSDPTPDEKTPPPITAEGCEGEMVETCAFLFGTMTFVVGTKKAAG